MRVPADSQVIVLPAPQQALRRRAARRAIVLRRSRTGVIHLALIAFAIALVARAAYVGLWEGRTWAAHAAREHETAGRRPLAARSDSRCGWPATRHQRESLVHLAVVTRARSTTGRCCRAHSPGPASMRRGCELATDPHRRWIDLPTRVLPGDAAAAAAIRGVYVTPVAERIALGSRRRRGDHRTRRPGGQWERGLEAGLDSVLRGNAGSGVLLHDALGRPLESPSAPASGVRAGDAIVLTINDALQEICRAGACRCGRSHGRQRRRHRRARPPRWRDSRAGEPAPGVRRRGGDDTDGAIRARVHDQALHRRGTARRTTSSRRPTSSIHTWAS